MMTPSPSSRQRGLYAARLRAWFASVTAGVLFLSTASAHASDSSDEPSSDPSLVARQQEAGDRYERAIKLYAEGEYRLALIEMQRAYDLAPSFQVRFNLGQIHQQLGSFSKALHELEQYLAEGGDEIAKDRQEQVRREIEGLKLKVARIRVNANQPGAVVFLDGSRLGVVPFADAVRVDAGEHRLKVEKPGFLSHEEPLILAGGDERTVLVELAPVPARGVILVGDGPSSTPMWVGWTSTAVLAAGAGITGGLAYSNAKELAQLRDTPNTLAADRDAAYDRARGLGLTSTVLTGAAVIGAGVSLYLTLRHLGAKRERAVVTGLVEPRSPKASWSVAASPLGIVTYGEF
jgi:tetratricopeptide (TPR) repeat protein